MKQTMEATVMQLFHAWNSHDVEAVLSIYHDYFVRENAADNTKYGKEKLFHVVTQFLNAFPDIHYEVDNLVENGNQAVVCWTARGHHKGKIMNIPATGKSVSFKGVSVLSIEENKISRVWYLWDQAGMLRQMGLLPDLHPSYGR